MPQSRTSHVSSWRSLSSRNPVYSVTGPRRGPEAAPDAGWTGLKGSGNCAKVAKYHERVHLTLLPSTLRLAAMACLLVASSLPVRAQDRLDCQADSVVASSEANAPVPDVPVDPDALDAGDEEIQLEAGEAELTLGGGASLSGGVRLQRSGFLLEAEQAEYDPALRALSLAGGVRYGGPDADVESDLARFSYDEGLIRFEDARFGLAARSSRGEAGLLQIERSGLLTLEDVSYTTCPPGKDDWLLLGDRIRL